MSIRSYTNQTQSNPARIGIFLDEWMDGGVPVFLERLERYLTRQGCEVFFFLAHPHPKREAVSQRLYAEMKTRLGDRCVSLDLNSLPRGWRAARIQEALFSHGIACLLVNHFYHYLDLIETVASEVPLVSIAHADVDHYYHEYLRSRRMTRAHIAVSRRIYEKTLSLTAPEDASQIKYIPYGVEDQSARFQPTPTGPLRVVYSARLDPVQKRCDDLLPIWKQYRADGGRGELIILGAGRHEKAMRHDFRDELDAGTVVMRGQLPTDQALDEMARADVLLNISNFEGLPQVALEGATLGLYPLLSRIESGHEEIVEQLGTGTLCHVGDIHAFASELRRLEAKLEPLRAGRTASRERALQHYAFDQCGQKYLEVIREVASPQPVTRQPDAARRSPAQWMDRAQRLVRYRRHFKS